MKIEITLTAEQEAALTRSLLSAHPDESSRPPLEEFAATIAAEKFKEHVTTWQSRDTDALASKLTRHAARLTEEDKTALETIVNKYDAPAEIQP